MEQILIAIRKCATVTHPFLAVGVREIIDSLGVPLLPEAEQVVWQEAILSHDHEVGEEAGQGLDHTDLTVRHRDQPVDVAAHAYRRNRCGAMVHPYITCTTIFQLFGRLKIFSLQIRGLSISEL